MNWNLKCRNCGFAFGVAFPDDLTDEEKTEIRTCPCGTLMDFTDHLEGIVLEADDEKEKDNDPR